MLAPLTNQQSELDGTASAYDHFWMEQLSQSGYALIQTCATTVEAGGIAFARQLGIHSDDHLPGLIRMATTVRNGGGLSAVQLHHAGHRANPLLGGSRPLRPAPRCRASKRSRQKWWNGSATASSPPRNARSSQGSTASRYMAHSVGSSRSSCRRI